MGTLKKRAVLPFMLFLGLFLVVIVVLVWNLMRVETRGPAEYVLDEDRAPSITQIVGERRLLSAEESTEIGLKKMVYTYGDIEDVREDIGRYIANLQGEQEFLLLEDWDALEELPGTVHMGRLSTQENYLFTITVQYSEKSYTIEVRKGAGALL